MRITPIRDQIIVKRKSEETMTKSGLIIPGSAQEKPFEGEVLAVGTGKVLDNGTVIPLEVKVGDKVLFTKYAISEVKLDGEDYIILKEDAILGVLTNE